MKKIMYSFFVFILVLFCSTNLMKVNASANSYYHYVGLTSSEKSYYNALEYMYNSKMFYENKTLDLVSSNFISQDTVHEFLLGSNDIYIDFENAKKAFFLDYEEIFYVDEDRLSISIYQDESEQIFVEIGSGSFESYLNINVNGLEQAIKDYDLMLQPIKKAVSKLDTLEEQISYILNNDVLDTPQKIKSVLDSLEIENFIYHQVGSLNNEENKDLAIMGQESYLNFYFQGEYFVEINSSFVFSEIVNSKVQISKPVNNYNCLENGKVQLLETKNEENESLKLASYQLDEKLDLVDVFAYSLYQLSFYQENEYVYELEEEQMVLLPFPSSFAYGSTNVEYGVKIFNEDTSVYEEIESVTTFLGLVCEIKQDSKVLVEARVVEEERTSHEIVILVSNGGSATVSKIAEIEEGKNLKINVSANKDFIVEKIAVDGTFIKFKPEAEFLYAINYDEVKDGSFVIIDFISEARFDEEHLKVKRVDQEFDFEIKGSHYAYIGGKPRFSVDGEFVGQAVYEWYYEDQLIARTTDHQYSFSPMKSDDRGHYKAKVIITNGLTQSSFETEEFKLYDSELLEEDPFPFTIILCGILFLGFIAFAIFDNASFKQVERKKR